MASKQISPAAQLLRHSKLFSVPDGISKPKSLERGVLPIKRSDSSTTAFPTRAAIITTNRGRKRGDWGMKRHLPLAKTATRNNPIIQINAVDNIDHITDYGFGTPHAIALKKFQEMNMPVLSSEYQGIMRQENIGRPISVFDRFEPRAQRESTLPSAKSTSNVLMPPPVERWKFQGPWLAGMDEYAFERYLEKRVKPYRNEFKAFTRQWMLRKKKAKAMSDQMAAGESVENQEITLSDAEYDKWLIELRHEGKQLVGIMWDFLDLPGVSPEEQKDQSIGPPATHPSAGLSYLRTNNVIENHPALGPMQQHRPVPVRELARSPLKQGNTHIAPATTLGIGGFVSNASKGGLWLQDEDRLATPGRRYVVPKHANVDEEGRAQIAYTKADQHSVALWDGEYDHKTQVEAEKQKEDIDRKMSTSPRNSLFASKNLFGRSSLLR